MITKPKLVGLPNGRQKLKDRMHLASFWVDLMFIYNRVVVGSH